MAKSSDELLEELTERQYKFVQFYLDLNNGTAAAIKAGYAESGAHVEASRMLRNPKIAAALKAIKEERREAVMNRLANMAAEAVTELYEIAMNSESDKVRVAALKDILDRSGYKPVEKRETQIGMDAEIRFGFKDPTANTEE